MLRGAQWRCRFGAILKNPSHGERKSAVSCLGKPGSPTVLYSICGPQTISAVHTGQAACLWSSSWQGGVCFPSAPVTGLSSIQGNLGPSLGSICPLLAFWFRLSSLGSLVCTDQPRVSQNSSCHSHSAEWKGRSAGHGWTGRRPHLSVGSLWR